MNGRESRLKVLRKLIAENKVASQDHLLQLLEATGVKVTQATLSRDLKVLKVGKVPDQDGGYFYVLSESEGENLQALMDDLKRGYLSIAFAGNLGVVKTIPGHANSVAFALDRLEIPEILGTIAGDDTILVILRDAEEAGPFAEHLEDMIGELEVEE